MDRRTLLTVSTAACLCGIYEAYAVFLSPIFSPRTEGLTDRGKYNAGEVPEKLPENRRQAEKYLADQDWVAEAKYQLRTESAYFYFQEWEPVEQSGEVRFKPFAMIWRPKGHDPAKDPFTIVSESARVEFTEKFEVTNFHPGRVVGGALEGKVRIRGPDGLLIDGQTFIFAERATRIWSDHAVSFLQGPHSGRGQGLELDLIPAPGPLSDDKPAVSGVRTIRLRKDVAMELVQESQAAGKVDDTIFIDSQGSFEYDVEAHVATFKNNVRVKRPTGKAESDRLNCELLTLIFEPDEAPAAKTGHVPAPPAPDPTPKEGFGLVGGNLVFRRLRAEGPQVTVVSQRSQMQAWMNELTYDDEARVIALRDNKRVRLLQKNNELLCPEITVVLDEAGEVERAICRGAGNLFSFARETPDDGPPKKKKVVALAAAWQKQLQKAPDARTGLDLIEFEGRAVLNRAGTESLRGDIIRIWVTPRVQAPGAPGTGEAPLAGADDDDVFRPKRLLALREVAFASPQIGGETERLEIWFDEGVLPGPPLAYEAERLPPGGPQPAAAKGPRAAAAVRSSRPWRRPAPARPLEATLSCGQSLAAVADDASSTRPPAKKRRTPPPTPRTEAAAPGPENPLSVTADVIRVRTLRESGDPQVSEVITEGRVHVAQEHKSGEAPLDLKGDHLHLWNYAGSKQVLAVEGRPAHVQDRGMHVEGPAIHFDRGQNLARVTGAGVLRVPVSKDLEGRSLDASQRLDVFWHERMDFDGQVAKFYNKVKTQLGGSEMQCEEMHVTFARRISFADDAPKSQQTELKLVLCRDGVELKNHEYKENRLVGARTAKGFEFTFDRETGRVTAQGPGTISTWRRGNGKRAGLEPVAGVRSNRPRAADTVEWEYTRIDFAGEMKGNTNDRVTTFNDRVRVVYGPVTHSTETIDEDSLPRDGGWMRCDALQLTQHPEAKKQPAYIEMEASGNTELDGRSFHAMAHRVTFDESKGLYVLSGDGRRDAKIWHEKSIGSERSLQSAQRMEFNPGLNTLKIDRASGGQGTR